MITGYALRAPCSRNAREYYENLKNGTDMTTAPVRYPEGGELPPRTGTLQDIDRFDGRFFRMSKKEVDKT